MKSKTKKNRKTQRKARNLPRAAASTLAAVAVLGAQSNRAEAYDDITTVPKDRESRRQMIALLEEQRMEVGLAPARACLFSGAGLLVAGVAMGIAGGAKVAKAGDSESYDYNGYTYGGSDKKAKKKAIIIGGVGGGLALAGAAMVGLCAKKAKLRKKEVKAIDEQIWELKYGELTRFSMSHGGRQRPALIRF